MPASDLPSLPAACGSLVDREGVWGARRLRVRSVGRQGLGQRMQLQTVRENSTIPKSESTLSNQVGQEDTAANW